MNVGASGECQFVSVIYRNEGCGALHLFSNIARINVDEFSRGFCKHPNVRRSMSCVVKYLLQWPATEERFVEEDRLNDHSWARIYDKEYHLGYINYPIGFTFAILGEEGLEGHFV